MQGIPKTAAAIVHKGNQPKFGFRRFFKRTTEGVLRRYFGWYLSKERDVYYKNLHIKVLPGIFHPGLFFSTKFLLNHLEGLEFEGKTTLEIGAGSGILSLYCASRGAKATATDISKTALVNIAQNSQLNKIELSIVHSNLFESLEKQQFDFILLNPPYYPKYPSNVAEMAWFCGEKFEYFKGLFEGMAAYIHSNTQVIMVLSEDCDIDIIESIANDNNFSFSLIKQTKIIGELNYLFAITKA